MRKVLFNIHLYLGLTLGLYFVLMGLTGSVLVFRDEVDAALNPGLLRVEAEGARLPFSEVREGFREHYPDEEVSRVVFPDHAEDVYEFWIGTWSASMVQVYVDPYTGRVLGERTLAGYAVGFVRYLHFNLMGGAIGWELNGYGGLLLGVVLLTGVVLWWPRKLRQVASRLWVKWRAGSTRVTWDLHNMVGMWTLPLMLVITVTGAAFVFRGPVQWVVYSLAGGPEEVPTQAVEATEGRPLPIDDLLAAGDAAAPEARTAQLFPPHEAGAPLSLYKHPSAGAGKAWGESIMVRVDPATGEVLEVKDSRRTGGQRIMGLVYPVHAGLFGGLVVRVVYAVVGLVPAALFVTGVLLWWWKRKRRKRRRSGSAGARARWTRHEAVPDNAGHEELSHAQTGSS